jgi:hypothetical protein
MPQFELRYIQILQKKKSENFSCGKKKTRTNFYVLLETRELSNMNIQGELEQ